MKLRYLFFLLFCSIILFSGCDHKKSELRNITSLQMKMDSVMSNGKKLLPAEESQAKNLISNYKEYAEKYPEDTLSPKFLFEAARLQMVIPDYPAALEILNTIAEKYPKDDLAPTSITTAAAICENILKNCDKAREYLQQLKEKYPNHPTAVNIDLQIEYVCDPEGYLDAVIEKNNPDDSDLIEIEEDSL